MVKKLSEKISEFLQLIQTVQENASHSKDELVRTEQLSMDYLHQLELETSTYHDRAKIAAGLRTARQQRRDAKNTLEVIEPLLSFVESDRGKVLIHQLREILGATRKAEKLISNRSYTPRVLTQEEYYSSRRKYTHSE